MARKQHPTPTGQDASRRVLASRRVRLATTWAAATGIALVGVFVELASASNHHAGASTSTQGGASTQTPAPLGGQPGYPGDDGGYSQQPGQVPYQGGGYVQQPSYPGSGYAGGGGPVSGAS